MNVTNHANAVSMANTALKPEYIKLSPSPAVPATVIMGYLGQRMGEIMDNPKNRADADYKLAVLNALKKMDKSITLQELNEKLTKQVAEPDLPEAPDDDIDV